MQYSFDEIHTLNLLSDDQSLSKRFNVPLDLRVITGLIVMIIFVVIICSFVFRVDKIVPAEGFIETSAKLFAVRSSQAGFISNILVKEGQKVKKGELMVQFDSERVELEKQRLGNELRAQARDLWTEFYQVKALVSLKTAVQLQNSILDVPDLVRRQGYQDTLSQIFPNQLDILTQTLTGVQVQLESNKRQLELADEILKLGQKDLDRLLSLLEKNYSSRIAIDTQQKQQLETKVQIETLTGAISEGENQKTRLSLERKQQKNEFITARLTQFHRLLDQYQQTITLVAQQDRLLNDLNIHAPFDAEVDQLLIRGKREALETGSTLLQLRPFYEQAHLQIEINIPSQYAIWVEAGMPFRASSRGNSPEDHGYIHGVVSFVSRSSELIEGVRMYRMRGKITKIDNQGADTANKEYEAILRPGRQLSVQITTGERRLINYIFDPFTQHFRTALTEP